MNPTRPASSSAAAAVDRSTTWWCPTSTSGAKGANTLDGQLTVTGLASVAYNLSYAQGGKGNGAGKDFMVADLLISRPFQYSDPNSQPCSPA
jgi:hypothetical protein